MSRTSLPRLLCYTLKLQKSVRKPLSEIKSSLKCIAIIHAAHFMVSFQLCNLHCVCCHSNGLKKIYIYTQFWEQLLWQWLLSSEMYELIFLCFCASRSSFWCNWNDFSIKEKPQCVTVCQCRVSQALQDLAWSIHLINFVLTDQRKTDICLKHWLKYEYTRSI